MSKIDPKIRAEYHRRYMEKLKADPVRYAEHLRKVAEKADKKRAEYNARYQAKRKADAPRHAEYLRKQAEKQAERQARIKADPEKYARQKEANRQRRADPDRAVKKQEYQKQWYAKLKADPEKYAKYIQEQNGHSKKSRARKMADPKLREAIRLRENEKAKQHRERYKLDPEKVQRTKEWTKQHRANNRFSYNRNQQVRKSRAKSVENTLTKEEWFEILEAQNNTCLGCDRPFDASLKPTMDHIIPLIKGGGLTKENVQALCARCNSSKHTKVIDYRSKQDRQSGVS